MEALPIEASLGGLILRKLPETGFRPNPLQGGVTGCGNYGPAKFKADGFQRLKFWNQWTLLVFLAKS